MSTLDPNDGKVTFELSTGPHGTREVFEYLRDYCAAGMYTDNYKHICDEVGRLSNGSVNIHPRGIGSRLGPIRSECIRNRVPWINALAVNLATWRPSDGFLPTDVNWEPAHEVLWRGMVLQTYCFDWTKVVVQ